jgi:hypothetical protein
MARSKEADGVTCNGSSAEAGSHEFKFPPQNTVKVTEYRGVARE